MKNIYKLLPILFIAVFISCGGGGDPAPAPASLTFEEKLQGTWNITSVTINGSDATSDYTGFQINFTSSSNYTITNGGTTFPTSSGQLGIQSTTDVGGDVFMGGITNVISFQFSSDNKTLTLSFTIDNTTFGLGGRESGLSGSYVFVLTKQ